MPASRKLFFLSAGALACHVVALVRHSAIASNIIEFVLIVLVTAACFQAANRAAGYARRFWRLGVAFGLYALGQAMASYYDSVLHASFQQYCPDTATALFHHAINHPHVPSRNLHRGPRAAKVREVLDSDGFTAP